jgi:hypothetical protein
VIFDVQRPPPFFIYGYNSGTGTRCPLGTRLDGAGHGNDFLSVDDTYSRLKSRRVRGGYVFSPTGNLRDTRYFTIAMILGCEQMKMYSFYDINYDLF